MSLRRLSLAPLALALSAALGLALVVLMIFRPQGLFPVRQQLLTYGKAARDLLRAKPTDTEPVK